MAILGASVLGASGQVASGRLLRLSLGATWRPSSAALGAVSGIVAGPPGSVGELTLVNPTTLGVDPFLAVVQGTHATNQGQYEVPNDGYATLAITAQHASQFRRNLVAVTVDDSQAAGVASSATTDRARLHLIEGALSATSPAPLPAVPANTLLLGEVAIPPTGQTVTLTGYNPRTTTRGGILPVYDDALTTPGHGGEPGVLVGQYRDHPARGMQRWDGTRWKTQSRGVGGEVGAWISFGASAASPANTVWGPGFPTAYAQSPGNDGLTFGSASDGFTVPISGMYLITWQISFGGGQLFGPRSFMEISTAATAGGRFPMGGPNEAIAAATTLLPVAAGAAVVLKFYANLTGTASHASSCRVVRVGDIF